MEKNFKAKNIYLQKSVLPTGSLDKDAIQADLKGYNVTIKLELA